MRKYFLLFYFLSCNPLLAIFNLENWSQNLVIESKQLIIPSYPTAFNPSIVRWKNKILMSFRFRDSETGSTDNIGLIFLDNNFTPIGKTYVLNRFYEHSVNSLAQDPRLIELNNKIYIVYSNFIQEFDSIARRMFICPLSFDNEKFSISSPICLNEFNGNDSNRPEKNWTPFIYNNNILLIYSISPHRILYPNLKSGSCNDLQCTFNDINWKWGELRGGTPAYLVDGQYLSFFHSSLAMATVQSDGKKITHYFTGAYTFSACPPFEITAISPHPIYAKEFYESPDYKTWKPLKVVFPGGFLYDDKYIWLAYGKQDHEIWVSKLNKEKLYSSFLSVNPRS